MNKRDQMFAIAAGVALFVLFRRTSTSTAARYTVLPGSNVGPPRDVTIPAGAQPIGSSSQSYGYGYRAPLPTTTAPALPGQFAPVIQGMAIA